MYVSAPTKGPTLINSCLLSSPGETLQVHHMVSSWERVVVVVVIDARQEHGS